MFRFWLTGARHSAADTSFTASLARNAVTRNQPPTALSFSPSGTGRLPKPFAILDTPDVLIAALKQAADANGTIIRLFEPTGEARRRVRVSLPIQNTAFETALEPFEIKTFRIDPQTAEAIETDLLEVPC